MNRKRPLEELAGGFVLGEVLALLPVVWIAGILAVLTARVCYLRKKNGRSPAWRLLPVFCLWGILWYRADAGQLQEYEAAAEAFAGKYMKAEGMLVGIQGRKGRDGAVLQLTDTVLLAEGEEMEYGDILVYLDESADLFMGERLQVEGRFERFDSPGNPGEFDAAGYYHAAGIEGRFFGERIRQLDQGYSPYLHGIYRLKCRGAAVFDLICTEEDRGVFRAVVLGEKTELSADIRKMYQNSGISHLLAVSGLHISVIGLGCYGLLKKAGLGFRGAGAAGMAVTVSYGILAGGTGISASVFRAVFMVLMQMSADCLGRKYDMRTAVSLSGLLLLLKSPCLLFQAGFQLSFGAVLTLAVAVPAAEKWLKAEKAWQKTLLAGAMIQLASAPTVAYHYFQYPVYGIFLNLAVIPLMSYVLVSGILGAVLGCLSVKAGMAAAGTGHYVLAFYRWLCERTGNLPQAVLVTGRPEIWQLAVYGLMWWVFLAAIHAAAGQEDGRRENLQRRAAFAALFSAVSLGILLFRPPVRGMEVTFLDVGQGDGICIRTEDTVVLTDGGSTDRKALGEQVLEPFLKSRGICRVDYAIVSHGDQDHISGLMELMEEDCGIRIRCVILPWLGQEEGGIYEEIKRTAEKHGAQVAWMRRGDRILEGKLEICCLYAGEEEKKGSVGRNEHSLMLQLSFGPAGVLLTGDMSAQGEKRWLERGETPRIQVLKTAHHGSSYSTGEEFLERVNPRWAVISCGRDNRYGHPGEDTLKRLKHQGVTWYVTMDAGAVTVKTDGREMTIETFRPAQKDRALFHLIS